MNLKHRISILAAGLLVMACTSESLLDEGKKDTDPVTQDANRQEVMLTLKNSLKLQPATTRADDPIATDEENYIRSLDVYVFGSPTEIGTYTFQELHYYRADASEVKVPGVEAVPFSLLNTTEGNTTKGLLKLNKGMFVKLYCVVNRTKLYTDDLTDPAVPVVKEYPLTDFISLAQTAPGQENNHVTVGSPTEETFCKLHTQLIDPESNDGAEDNVLNIPLPMSGAYTTPVDLTDFSSAARKQISFRLTRMVARFDIVNNAAESKFTVEHVSMGNGRLGASFFPIEPLAVPDAKTDLISYPARSIEAETQQEVNVDNGTTDTTKGAFYTWPSPKDDMGYLMLKGRYQVNKTETKEVSYQIPFMQSKNGVGTYIEVQHNHRYTIAITKADEYHLDFELKVEDWGEDAAIDPYQPDNEFDKNADLKLEASSEEAYVNPETKEIVLLAADKSQADFIMGSNSVLDRELRFKEGSKHWIKDVTKDEPATRAGVSMKKLMSFAVDATQLGDDETKLLPVTVRLTNRASGESKDIIISRAVGPTLGWTPVPDVYTKFDEASNTAYFYNLDNQVLKLAVKSELRVYDDESEVTGSSLDLTKANYITADKNESADQGTNYVLTLKTAQGAIPTPADAFNVKSTASKASASVKVVLKSPEITTQEVKDFSFGTKGGSVAITATTDVNLTGVLNNYVDIAVISPEGLVDEINADDYVTGGSSWLKVERISENTYRGEKKRTILRASIKDATDMGTTPKTDGVITLKNLLDPTKTLVINVKTSLPAGPVVTRDEQAGDMSSFDHNTLKVTMFNAATQTVTLRTDSPTKVTLPATDAVDCFESFGTDLKDSHTITLKTAQTLPIATPPSIVLTNEDGGETVVTFNLISAAPSTLEKEMLKMNAGKEIYFDETVVPGPGTNARIVLLNPKATDQFQLINIVSPRGLRAGATGDPATFTNEWITIRWTTDNLGEGGTKKSSFIIDIDDIAFKAAVAAAAESAGGDGKTLPAGNYGSIVLKNVIAGGEDMVIDIKVTDTPQPEPVP